MVKVESTSSTQQRRKKSYILGLLKNIIPALVFMFVIFFYSYLFSTLRRLSEEQKLQDKQSRKLNKYEGLHLRKGKGNGNGGVKLKVHAEEKFDGVAAIAGHEKTDLNSADAD